MRRGGGVAGPLIVIGVMILVIVIAVVFGNLIFSSAEEQANLTAISNESYAAYNTTTGMVQGEMTMIQAAGYIFIFALILVVLFLMYRAIR